MNRIIKSGTKTTNVPSPLFLPLSSQTTFHDLKVTYAAGRKKVLSL
jgi:hypothetical protein